MFGREDWKKIWIVTLFVVMVMVPASYSQDVRVAILVSDNEADMAVAVTVEKILASKGVNVKVFVTPWGVFNKSVAEEIKNFAPTKVVIVGGELAVVPEYESVLSEFNILRAKGKDRYETAAKTIEIVKDVFKVEISNIVVVYGFDDDALEEIVEKAEELNAFVVLVKNNEVPPMIKQLLKEIKPKRAIFKKAPNIEKEVEVEIEKEVGELEIEEHPMKERTLEEIKEAEEKLEEAKEKFAEYTGVAKTAVERLIKLSEKELEEAKESYNKELYGRAYGLAVSSKVHAKNAIKIMEKVQVEAFLNIYGKRFEEMRKLMEEIREKKMMLKEEMRNLKREYRDKYISLNCSENYTEECEKLIEEYREKTEELLDKYKELEEIGEEMAEELREKVKESKERIREMFMEEIEKMKEKKKIKEKALEKRMMFMREHGEME